MPNMDPKKCPMPSQDPNVRIPVTSSAAVKFG